MANQEVHIYEGYQGPTLGNFRDHDINPDILGRARQITQASRAKWGPKNGEAPVEGCTITHNIIEVHAKSRITGKIRIYDEEHSSGMAECDYKRTTGSCNQVVNRKNRLFKQDIEED